MPSFAAAAFVLMLLAACGGGPGAQQPGVQLHSAVASGVTFLAPVGASGQQLGEFDPAVSVAVAAFRIMNGEVSSSPVGVEASVFGGGVTVHEDAQLRAYQVLWNASAAGVGAGQPVRLEVRLPTAPAGEPACTDGVDLLDGCLAFVDVVVEGGNARVGQVGGQPRAVALENGALPVRFHVEEHAVAVRRVTLGAEPVTVEFAAGAVAEFPALPGGQTATVDVALLPDNPVDELALIEWASDSLVIRFRSEVQWPEGQPVRIRLPVDDGELGPQFSWGGLRETVIGTVTSTATVVGDVAKEAAGIAKDVAVFGYEALSGVGEVVLDVSMVGIETSGEVLGGVIHTLTYTRPKNLKSWRDSFKPPVEGIFAVRPQYIPSINDASVKGCTQDLINAGLAFHHLPNASTPLSKSSDTAVVMVHGWQTLTSFYRGGDTQGTAAHCRIWLDVMAAYAHGGGDWSALRDGTDLFTFRYDSDHRIRASGAKLSTALQQLRDRGYSNVILLGHSMGGLVSVQARELLGNSDLVAGIVTLATPFMGGPLICAETIIRTVAGVADEYCTRILVPPSPDEEMRAVLLEYLDLGDGSVLDGTYDLMTYYTPIVPGLMANPYLQRLWSNSGNFDGITAHYGDSSRLGWAPGVPYVAIMGLMEAMVGASDGVVPRFSAVASSVATDNRSQAVSNSQLGSSALIAHARDHSQMVGGCTACADGRKGVAGAYDPYFDDVASSLKGVLDSVAPTAGADLIISGLTVTPATLSAGSNTIVNFSVTNLGDSTAGASTTSIRVNTSNSDVTTSDQLLLELSTPAIAGGEAVAYSESVTLPASVAGGAYFVWVIADVSNVANQVNYDNDRANYRITVGEATSQPACTVPDQEIDIPDVNLRSAIALELGTGNGPILCRDIQGLTWLEAPGQDIQDINGLQHATNLTQLYLAVNEIADFSPLASLTNLTDLSLWGHQYSDLTALANLTNLDYLDLWVIGIRDISVLSGLTNLTSLSLGSDDYLDISVLENLTNLTYISLGGEGISDISVLTGLTSLTWLHLGDGIGDISALSSLTHLTKLSLWLSDLDDISMLAFLTNLTELNIGTGAIRDFSVLADLTTLVSLTLWRVGISDISVLANLTNLAGLFLFHDHIGDISALANLTNITTLYLVEGDISDVSVLANLSNLSLLDVSGNRISDISLLANLIYLRNLYLTNNCLDVSIGSPSHTIINLLVGRGAYVEYDRQRDCSLNPGVLGVAFDSRTQGSLGRGRRLFFPPSHARDQSPDRHW